MWRERGPNAAPTFTELHLDWSVAPFAEQGVAHGNVLLVQQHPSLMARNLLGTSKLPTAPEWIRNNQASQK